MAKDRELQDHERAHTGKAGSDVDHGWGARERLFNTMERFPDYGYRRVHAVVNMQGTKISQRQVRKHMGIGRENQDD